MYARAVRTPTLLLALAVASFAPFQARADVATPGYRHVPLELTLQVKGLESSSGLVVLGCNSANGRHSLAFPESGAMIRCQIKHPAEIFVAKAADVSALRALVDKDVGWGQEIMNAREILDPKATSCGKLAERTYLEEKLGIEKVVARYEVVIQKSECSLSRLDPDAAAPASSAAPGPSAAPSRDERGRLARVERFITRASERRRAAEIGMRGLHPRGAPCARRSPLVRGTHRTALPAPEKAMSERRRYASGTPWEDVVGYSRAVRVGDHVVVSGTTATLPDGSIDGVGDPRKQTLRALDNVRLALEALGASLADVVRTRIYVTDITTWEVIGSAHGEVFGSIRPVTSMLEVRALIRPEILVEIEADAVVAR